MKTSVITDPDVLFTIRQMLWLDIFERDAEIARLNEINAKRRRMILKIISSGKYIQTWEGNIR